MHVATVIKLPVLQQGHTLQEHSCGATEVHLQRCTRSRNTPSRSASGFLEGESCPQGVYYEVTTSVSKCLAFISQHTCYRRPITPALPVVRLDLHCALYVLCQMQAYLIAMSPKPLPLLIMKFVLKAHLRRSLTLSMNVSCTELCIREQWVNHRFHESAVFVVVTVTAQA